MSLADKELDTNELHSGILGLFDKKDVKEFIKRVKESKKAIKEKIYYKSNNLDFQVGMEQGFDEAMMEIDKEAGEGLIK